MRSWSLRRVLVVTCLGLSLIFCTWMVSSPAHAETTQVTVGDNFYDPEPVTISPGTTITWTNQGNTTHSVSSDDGSGEQFDSGDLQTKQAFSHTFNQVGAFTYHCVFHEEMLGTIIVESSSGATGSPVPTSTFVPRPTALPTPKPPKRTSNTVLSVHAGDKYVFNPKIVKIKVGKTLSWKNKTDVPHTVTSQTKGWKFNKNLGSRKPLNFAFKHPGTYRYHCIFHPGMSGKILVHR